MSLNLEHASPTKGNYEDEEPMPEENLSDNSFENNKLLPHTRVTLGNTNPIHNIEKNEPIDPSGKKSQ